VLAATAFVLALAGTVVQGLNFVRGASVSLYSPEFVTLFFDTYPNGDTVVRFAATINYVNSGEATYGAVVRKERLTYTLASKKFEQDWQSFQDIDRSETSILFRNQTSARPTPVPGASAISHTTIFAPRPAPCTPSSKDCSPFKNYQSRSEFLKALSETSMQLTFYAQLAGRNSELEAKCDLKIDAGLVALLAMNNWYYAVCY
jgi:hypothetical protein